ncbi:MAG TPA: hypothetical protein VNC60_11100 [Actinomycetota bacterium]|nr:hypothetical protein [Actinomycetota bacterium]
MLTGELAASVIEGAWGAPAGAGDLAVALVAALVAAAAIAGWSALYGP